MHVCTLRVETHTDYVYVSAAQVPLLARTGLSFFFPEHTLSNYPLPSSGDRKLLLMPRVT